MTAADEREAVLELSSTLEDLGRLYPWLDEAATAADVPAALRPRMHVALEEAAANIAMHAYPAGETGPITVRLQMRPDAALLVVEDNGAAFDPTTADLGERPKSLAEATPGGWGLDLIRHFCPAATYERRGESNRLTMSFPIG
ncbi:MAG TPA: ATP-binding protein [Caulobacteraceae bacterium]|nr:ATP-binding protein [Caulobacteraceae bacterium]